jgi:flavodoxin
MPKGAHCMNTLIIYDSKFGNTEKIAQAMATALGEHGTVHLVQADKANAFNLVNATDIELLIVGGPTQLHGVSPAMKALLNIIPPHALRGLPTVCFDTRYDSARWISGSAGHRMGQQLVDKGAYVMAQPESFFVGQAEGPLQPGELNRAVEWIEGIVARLAVPNKNLSQSMD